MVFERIRELLSKNRLPPGTGELLARVRDTQELLRELDSLVTRNEVAVSKLNDELAALERLEAEEREKVRSGALGPRSRASVLRRILRLRQQMDHIEDRLKIHDRNIRLHLDLIGVLKQIEAMSMAGVKEEEVDALVLRFSEELKSYQASLTSGEVLRRRAGEELELPGEEELASLEAEILAEQPERGKESAEAAREERREGEALEAEES